MKRLVLSLALIMASMNAQAVPTACGGYLCVVIGYAHPDCRPAWKAAVKRMLKGKSPLPAFSNCTNDGKNPEGFDVVRGNGALLQQMNSDGVRIIVGPICNHRDSGPSEPAGCIETVKTYQIMRQGEPFGHMMIFHNSEWTWTRDNATGVIKRVRFQQ